MLGQNRCPGVERCECGESVSRSGPPSAHCCYSALCERFDSRVHRTRVAVQATYVVHRIPKPLLEHKGTRAPARTVYRNG